jgi:cysteine synthase A
MAFAKDVIDLIGNTPLIKLKKASELTGCTILGKAEFLNPGQSVKDRAALFIVKDAINKGLIKPGGTIVEGTAGNTGIGLTMVANAMGFKSVIVIPETQTQEKKDALRLLGAELVEVPAKPYRDPNNYVKYSGRLAERLSQERDGGAIWANQFDNVANRQAHIETTGLEIWEQTGGKVDGFICAAGSGGTIAGTGMALKERNKDIRIGLADPHGAALYSYYTTGELKAEGSSITEGIGQGRITANLEGAPIDFACRIRTRKPSISSSTCCRKKGCAWADRAASTLPVQWRWPKSWARGTQSSPYCATTATATSRSSTTPPSCARKTCRYQRGWNGRLTCRTSALILKRHE